MPTGTGECAHRHLLAESAFDSLYSVSQSLVFVVAFADDLDLAAALNAGRNDVEQAFCVVAVCP